MIDTVKPYKYFCIGLILVDFSQMDPVDRELNELYNAPGIKRWVFDKFYDESKKPKIDALRMKGQALQRALSMLESDLYDFIELHKKAYRDFNNNPYDSGVRVVELAEKIGEIKCDIRSVIKQAQKLFKKIQSIEAEKLQSTRTRWRHIATKNGYRGNYPKMAATVLHKKLYPPLKALMRAEFPRAYVRAKAIRRFAKNYARKKTKKQTNKQAGPRALHNRIGSTKKEIYRLRYSISNILEAERTMRIKSETKFKHKCRTRSERKTYSERKNSISTMLDAMWDGMRVEQGIAYLQMYAKLENIAVQRLCTILKTDAKTVYAMFRLVGPATEPASPASPTDLTKQTWTAINRLRIATLRETTYFVELLLKHLRPASSVAHSIGRILDKFDSANANANANADPGFVKSGRQILKLYSNGRAILSACSKIMKVVTLLRNAKTALLRLERYKIARHLTRVYKHTICELNRQLAKRCRAVSTFGLKSRPEAKRSAEKAKEFGVAYGRAVQKLETRARNIGSKMSSYVLKLDPAIIARCNLLLRLAKHEDDNGSAYQIPINPKSRAAQHFKALSDSYYASVLKTGMAKNIWLKGMPNFSEIRVDGPAKYVEPKFLDVVFDETINITWSINLHKGCYASPLALQSALSQTLLPSNYQNCALQKKIKQAKDATEMFDVLIRCPMKGKSCAGHMLNLSNISIPRSSRLGKKVVEFYSIDPAEWDAWRNLHFKRCAEVRKFLVVRRLFAFKYGIPLETSANLLSCEYCEALGNIGFWINDRCRKCGIRKCSSKTCFGMFDIPQAYFDLMGQKRKVYSHNGNTCAEYAELAEVGEEGLTIRLIKTLKRCPKCQSPAILREGCNHITCICKADWCYVCGKELIAANLGGNVYNHYKRFYTQQNPCNQYQNNR